MVMLRALALLLICAIAPGAPRAAPPPPHLEIRAARDFGYTMGSLIEHQVRLWLPEGAALLPPLLPSPGAINDWLDLREIRWQQEGPRVIRIDLTYQVFRGVRDPETVVIPPLAIPYRAGGMNTEILTPPWPFGMIPLIPPATPDEKVILRPAVQASPFPAEAASARFIGFLSAAGLGLLGLAFRLGWIAGFGRRRPFAEACHRLGRLRTASPEVQFEQGLRLVHEALARTHGEPVFPAMLREFFEQHPVFAPLRTDFEAFFTASQHHFFDPDGTSEDPAAAGRALAALCRRCARLERHA